MSKTQNLERLIGSGIGQNLSPDAMMGLNSLARRCAGKSEEDQLFEVALRRANDEELRKLARFRMEAETSKYND